MVITSIDIVDGNQTAVFPLKRTTLGTTANVADILVVIPQIVATDSAAIITLDEDAAAPSLIAPAVPGLVDACLVTKG